MAKKTAAKHRDEFINREISWLAFNDRVLQEALDKSVPLIERMRFLGIFSNNLDEFFKVRVATLRRATSIRSATIDPMDFDPAETLTGIYKTVAMQQEKFDEIFLQLAGDLKDEGIFFLNETELSKVQKKFVEEYFEAKVRPYLVPLMLRYKTPFPALNDNSIYLAIELGYKTKKTSHAYALIEVPQTLPRFIELPAEGKKRFVMFLDDVIRFRLRKVFGIFEYDYARAYTLKITRDAELDIDDDLSKSLVDKMSRSLSQRKRGVYVRLTTDQEMPEHLLEFIIKKIKIKDTENVIHGGRYHNKKDLMKFPDFGRTDLCYPVLAAVDHPRFKGKTSLIDEIGRGDILLHYPYHTFVNILDLLREAAIDPTVRTIRISIYRLAKNSQVLNVLINAARNGKRVIAVVEVQARFDEQNNIEATRALQESGARVIPGVPGLKVHSKLIQISRKEGGKTVRYVHIGSGNFHEKTASVYSDISLLTANREIGREVRKIFDFFESNYTRSIFRHLLVSPFSTRRKFTDLINEEILHAEKGRKAFIILKMNNLVDAGMIKKLYDASRAGVKIDLIIRGICSLVPGVAGLSENIKVRSIVGRYLEHSRILVFGNNGKPHYFISSADWMTRNLDHRIEVTTPVYDALLRKELQDYLDIQLDPGANARKIDKSLKNEYISGGTSKHGVDSQVKAYQYFKKRSEGR